MSFPSSITFLHADVRDWRETSRITRVAFADDSTTIEHTKSGAWPVLELGDTDVEGNPWILARVDGRWFAATYEWLRPNQTKKWITAASIGPHTKRAPLDAWTPRDGELVGFLVSTPARDGQRTSDERSDVWWTKWGDGARVAFGEEPPIPPSTPPTIEPDLLALIAAIRVSVERTEESVRTIRTIVERAASRFDI